MAETCGLGVPNEASRSDNDPTAPVLHPMYAPSRLDHLYFLDPIMYLLTSLIPDSTQRTC